MREKLLIGKWYVGIRLADDRCFGFGFGRESQSKLREMADTERPMRGI